MSIEQYSEDVIVIAVAEGPSAFKVWLREEATGGLADDLQWLREEYMDSHIVLDLADLESLETTSYGLMLDLQRLAEEYDCRFFVCGLSPPLNCLMKRVRLSRKFDTFDTREAALTELCPEPRD